MIDRQLALAAIRARDAKCTITRYSVVYDGSDGAIDRRALLASYDALLAENAALREALANAVNADWHNELVESLRKDAERYRWIHDNIDWVDDIGYVLNTLPPDADGVALFQWGIDTAIDAAMETSHE